MKAMKIFSCFQLVLAPSAATGPAGRQGDGLLVKSVAGWVGSRERSFNEQSGVCIVRAAGQLYWEADQDRLSYQSGAAHTGPTGEQIIT